MAINDIYVFFILLANTFDELLHLTLRPEEMEHIVSYLKTVNKPLSHDLLVLHYLQQSKLIDAVQLESMSSATVVSSLCDVLSQHQSVIDVPVM